MKNEKGFTLIELLIVFAIIGILVSVAMKAFQNESTDPYGSSNSIEIKSNCP